MCMSCGCMKPDEDHGDTANITMKDIEQAAEAAGLSTEEVVNNIKETHDEVVR